MKRSAIIFLSCFFTSLFTLQAKDWYLLFDGNYMDRYVYQFSDGSMQRDYVVYQVNQGGDQRLVLEVGSEMLRFNKNKPATLRTSLKDVKLKDLYEGVNKGGHQVYVVHRNTAGEYGYSPVSLAAIYQSKGEQLVYEGLDFKMEYGTNGPVNGLNLAAGASQSEVFYQGTRWLTCNQAYRFRKVPKSTAKPFTEWTVVPGIGIIEERTGLTPDEASSNGFTLQSVNGIPFERYLDEKCNGLMPKGVGIDYSKPLIAEAPVATTVTEENIPAAYEMTGAPVVKTTATGPCTEVSGNGNHIVQAGETLFGITRKYSISLDQLKSWNGLVDNTIYPCMKLRVEAPAAGTTTTTVSSGGQFTPKGGSTEVTTTTTVPATPAWKTTNGVHEVKAGETVAQIARLYGYTEDRFREVNGLNKIEQVYAGQYLRTTDCVCPAVTSPAPYEASGSRIQVTSSGTTTTNNSDQLTAKGNTATASSPNVNSVRRLHIVKEGETLQTIARMYGLTVEKLQDLNRMDRNEVVIPFQKIYLD